MSPRSLLAFLVLWAGCDGGAGGSRAIQPPDAAALDAGGVDAVTDGGADSPAGEAGADGGSAGDVVADTPIETSQIVIDASGSCTDGLRDGDETDVDCGGSCPGCGPRKGCLVDSDCSVTASGCDSDAGGCRCDAVTLTCVYDHCYDHKQDGGETSVDCGGGTCAACARGAPCLVDSDCVSMACDGVTLTCASSQCSDHRTDGEETGVDCGGSVCAACASGQPGHYSFDCQSGFCQAIDAGTGVCE